MAGKKTERVIERDKKLISPSLTREVPFVFSRGKGSYVWDVERKKFLDFSAGVAVNVLGHCNARVKKAITKQLEKGTHMAFSDFYAELPLDFAEEILEEMPWKGKVFFANSGTEAVEAGYKAARWHTKKRWFISFKGSFHGRTMGALSLTSSKKVHKERFSPFLPVRHVDYPYAYKLGLEEKEAEEHSIGQVEEELRRLNGKVAGIFVEPILGEGGYVVPPRDFLKRLQKICKREGIPLCADEVQTGVYRTGSFLASTRFGAKPDIIAMAKAIGGGLPLGVMVARNKYMEWGPGTHANTFGGNLLACAAGMATLRELKGRKIWKHVDKVGGHLHKRLVEIKEEYDIVGDVRGVGLMQAIELDKKIRNRSALRDNIIFEAFNRGLLILPAGEASIRFCPPLIIKKEEVNRFADILAEAIKHARKCSIKLPEKLRKALGCAT